jgi:hypothetical protein
MNQWAILPNPSGDMNIKGRMCISFLRNAAINTASYLIPAETSSALRMAASLEKEMAVVPTSYSFAQTKL